MTFFAYDYLVTLVLS